MQNKIFTTLNQPLKVAIYTLPDKSGAPTFYSTLNGVPIGTVDDTGDGELAAKVMIVADRSPQGAAAAAVIESSGPATDAEAVVASDDELPISPTSGLYIGTTGNITVKMSDRAVETDVVVFANLPAGTILPIRVTHVMLATTAADIVALYN